MSASQDYDACIVSPQIVEPMLSMMEDQRVTIVRAHLKLKEEGWCTEDNEDLLAKLLIFLVMKKPDATVDYLVRYFNNLL